MTPSGYSIYLGNGRMSISRTTPQLLQDLRFMIGGILVSQPGSLGRCSPRRKLREHTGQLLCRVEISSFPFQGMKYPGNLFLTEVFKCFGCVLYGIGARSIKGVFGCDIKRTFSVDFCDINRGIGSCPVFTV